MRPKVRKTPNKTESHWVSEELRVGILIEKNKVPGKEKHEDERESEYAMTFEIFQRGRHYHQRETIPFVSVYRGTRITFSKPCADFFAGVSYVLFLYDKEDRKVAFKPTTKDGGGYVFHLGKGQAYVSARSLLEKLGIKDALRIPALLEDGMIVFKYEKMK